jgi:hypothetical protein
LQRRFSVTLRLSLFGDHVGALRALGLPLTQVLLIPTGPAKDTLHWPRGGSFEQWRALVGLRFLSLPFGCFEGIRRIHEKGFI